MFFGGRRPSRLRACECARVCVPACVFSLAFSLARSPVRIDMLPFGFILPFGFQLCFSFFLCCSLFPSGLIPFFSCSWCTMCFSYEVYRTYCFLLCELYLLFFPREGLLFFHSRAIFGACPVTAQGNTSFFFSQVPDRGIY